MVSFWINVVIDVCCHLREPNTQIRARKVRILGDGGLNNSTAFVSESAVCKLYWYSACR